MAGNAADDNKETRTISRNLQLAIRNDIKELNTEVLSRVQFIIRGMVTILVRFFSPIFMFTML